MADAYHPHSVKSHGVETSIDLVRKNTRHTTSIAGSKRPSEHEFPVSAHKDGYGAIRSVITRYRPAVPPPCLQASSIKSVSSLHETNDAAKVPEYSQRKHLASTPGPTQDPLLSLSHPRYGLRLQLISNFTSLGVHAIYPWQSSCLLGRGLLSGETNLIYTAPTGGGKSLVADVLLLKRVIEKPSKKAILVLPYVALVQEKLKWFRKLVEGVSKNMDGYAGQDAESDPRLRWKTLHSHVRVAGFFGGSKARATWVDIDIAICTIEKVGAASTRCLPSPNPLTGKCSGQHCNRRWPNRRLGSRSA
jgi:DEAD/DEAH box helicase